MAGATLWALTTGAWTFAGLVLLFLAPFGWQAWNMAVRNRPAMFRANAIRKQCCRRGEPASPPRAHLLPAPRGEVAGRPDEGRDGVALAPRRPLIRSFGAPSPRGEKGNHAFVGPPYCRITSTEHSAWRTMVEAFEPKR